MGSTERKPLDLMKKDIDDECSEFLHQSVEYIDGIVPGKRNIHFRKWRHALICTHMGLLVT